MPNRLTLALGLAAAPALAAAQDEATRVSTQSHVVMPAKAEATPARIDSLQVPEGFRVEPFATGLKNARILAVSPEGRVYVSRRDQGDVLLLEDGDGDGRADGQPRTVANRPGAHGIAIHDGRFYLTSDPPHHYHFQVFALDTELDVQPGADRDTVLDAAAGHVIAAGELVGTFQQQSPPTR